MIPFVQRLAIEVGVVGIGIAGVIVTAAAIPVLSCTARATSVTNIGAARISV
jgi:hypothetical protein